MAQGAVYVAMPIHANQMAPILQNMSVIEFTAISISTFAIANIVTQPVTGLLIDRSGRRLPWVQLGLLLLCIGTLLLAFANTTGQIMMMHIIRGIGFGLTVPASVFIASDQDSGNNRGTSIGVFFTIRTVGFAIGPILGGALIDHMELDNIYVLTATLTAMSLILTYTIRHIIHEHGVRPSTKRRPFFHRDFANVRIVSIGVTLALMIVGTSFLMPLLNEFRARLQESNLGITTAFSATLLTCMVLQAPVGRYSDRTGRIKPIVAGFILMAPATMLQGFVHTITPLVVLRILQGISMALVMTPAFALIADLSTRETRGRQLSVGTMGIDIGAGSAPLIAAFLYSNYMFELPFLVGGMMSILGLLIIMVVSRNTEQLMSRATT